MIHDALKATAITLFTLMIHAAVNSHSSPIVVPSATVITPAGSDAPAFPVDTTTTATTSDQDAVSTLAVASYAVESANEAATLRDEVTELQDTIRDLRLQIESLTQPVVEQPKPRQAAPVVYQQYSSCGPGGCGNGRFRIFGRRR